MLFVLLLYSISSPVSYSLGATVHDLQCIMGIKVRYNWVPYKCLWLSIIDEMGMELERNLEHMMCLLMIGSPNHFLLSFWTRTFFIFEFYDSINLFKYVLLIIGYPKYQHEYKYLYKHEHKYLYKGKKDNINKKMKVIKLFGVFKNPKIFQFRQSKILAFSDIQSELSLLILFFTLEL